MQAIKDTASNDLPGGCWGIVLSEWCILFNDPIDANADVAGSDFFNIREHKVNIVGDDFKKHESFCCYVYLSIFGAFVLPQILRKSNDLIFY